jgi:uncharacterized membrane protein SirB2
MIEYYPQIKAVHHDSVLASGALFALRGALVLAGQRWALALPLRIASWTIDSVLLTAALILMNVLHIYPVTHDWLTLKVALLVVYVVLGTWALRRGRSLRAQALAYAAALAVYATMYGMAKAHHPLGWLRWLGWA